MIIPDIKDDPIAVDIIDELKYRLKGRFGGTIPHPISDALDQALSEIIERFHLDGDPDNFATLP